MPFLCQERLGVQLATLLEDPEGATVLRLAREAHAALKDREHSGGHEVGSGAGAGRQAARSAWIAPAPASVRMRLFCLPYAGGVSENVFARRARPGNCCISAVAPFASAEEVYLLLALPYLPVSLHRPALGTLKPLYQYKRVPELSTRTRDGSSTTSWQIAQVGGAGACLHPGVPSGDTWARAARERARSDGCSRACARARACPAPPGESHAAMLFLSSSLAV